MFSILHAILNALGRFQNWFDRRYGWFFTNGMKEYREPR